MYLRERKTGSRIGIEGKKAKEIIQFQNIRQHVKIKNKLKVGGEDLEEVVVPNK